MNPFENLPIRLFDDPTEIQGITQAIAELKAGSGRERPTSMPPLTTAR